MRKVGTTRLRYDPLNLQEPYTYMARIIGSNEIAVGNIVIGKPAYSPKEYWKYFIEYNEYKGYGAGNRFVDLGLKRVEINPDTIIPFNQIAQIKMSQEEGYDVILEGKNLPGLRDNLLIAYNEEIPKNLYLTAGRSDWKKYDKYGAHSGERVKRDVVKDIIENKKIEKRKELLEAITKFWNEYKGKYRTIMVALEESDYEIIEECDDGSFTHSLTSIHFDNMGSCITNFVKCVNPNDVGAFDYGNCRKTEE